MNYIKKISAAAIAAVLGSTLTGCTPSIGASSKTALTIEGYEIPAGVFIYYSMQGYSEAASILQKQNGEAPEIKDVRNANIDSIDSTDWIQNKATEYCVDYAGLLYEFDKIDGKLSAEQIDQAAQMAEYYYAQDSRLPENGVSVETLKKIIESSYIEQTIFKHYYDFDGELGCSEDELKEYFTDNFARVKYFSISLNDESGEKVAPDKERELRNMAKKYCDQVNKKSGEMNRLMELDAVKESYEEYVAAQTTAAEDEEIIETTTTAVTDTEEETTTTTTNPYENERLIQLQTTTESTETSEDTETEAAEESESARNSRLFNEFLFNELKMGEAAVYDYSDTEIYIVMRAELSERMTEDDYWSADYIENLQQMKFYDEFTKMLDEKADQLTVEKNKTAYRRYAPFKLVLEYK